MKTKNKNRIEPVEAFRKLDLSETREPYKNMMVIDVKPTSTNKTIRKKLDLAGGLKAGGTLGFFIEDIDISPTTPRGYGVDSRTGYKFGVTPLGVWQ